MDITLNVLSYVSGYPRGFHYVFMNSQGTNEFGSSRGFEEIWMPSLLYDSGNRCVSGGHRPSGSVTGMCVDATWPDAPAPAPSNPTPPPPPPPPPASTSEPSHAPTAALTRSPTRSPTPAPVSSPASGGNDNSCRWANDGYCDEPTYCSSGTDCTDCGNCGGTNPPPPPPPPPTTTSEPSRSPTATLTRSPTSAPVASSSCVDGNPGITLNGSPATCTQLQPYCDHSSLGAQITSSCPLTCGANGCTAPCQDMSSTGITINGAEATCSQLQSYCTSHASMVVPKCRRTCGDC
jgi:hypothetical protein